MTPRIITSGPDQAYPQAQTAWQRERAGGRLVPMECDQDWIVVRFSVGDMLAVLVGFIAIGACAWFGLGLAT